MAARGQQPRSLIQMAKAELNFLLSHLRGSLGGLVFKRYRDGLVVTRAQRAQRDRFRQAAQIHRSVLADPALKKR